MSNVPKAAMNELYERICHAIGISSLTASGVVGCVQSPDWIEVGPENSQATLKESRENNSGDEDSPWDETDKEDDELVDDGPVETTPSDHWPEDCSFEELEIEPKMPGQCFRIPPPDSPDYVDICFLPPDGVACEEEPYSRDCLLSRYSCGVIPRGNDIHCGPVEQEESGACCYRVVGFCAVGRPLHVDGEVRLAEIESGPNWSAPHEGSLIPQIAELSEETRRVLAEFWAKNGLAEHASVASFSRFMMQLLSLGAPAELVEEAQDAMGDEIEHARHCFCLASTYAGEFLQPSPLNVSGCMSDAHLEPQEIAKTLASEGCVAETVSTMLLIGARDQARDPAIKEILSSIIEQEMEHVVLAWKALAWILEQKVIPSQVAVLEAVLEVFSSPQDHVGFGPVINEVETRASSDHKNSELFAQQEPKSDSRSSKSERPAKEISVRQLAEHGYLNVEVREAIASRTLETIIRPLARNLLEKGRPFLQTTTNPASKGIFFGFGASANVASREKE